MSSAYFETRLQYMDPSFLLWYQRNLFCSKKPDLLSVMSWKTATWSSEISCPAEPSGHGIKDFDAICLVVHRVKDDEMMMLRIGECLTEIVHLLQNFGKQETCNKNIPKSEFLRLLTEFIILLVSVCFVTFRFRKLLYYSSTVKSDK